MLFYLILDKIENLIINLSKENKETTPAAISFNKSTIFYMSCIKIIHEQVPSIYTLNTLKIGVNQF